MRNWIPLWAWEFGKRDWITVAIAFVVFLFVGGFAVFREPHGEVVLEVSHSGIVEARILEQSAHGRVPNLQQQAEVMLDGGRLVRVAIPKGSAITQGDRLTVVERKYEHGMILFHAVAKDD